MKAEEAEKFKPRKWKMFLRAGIIILIGAGILMLGLFLYGEYQSRKIAGLSFREALEYTTKGNSDAVITVGIIQNGESSYTVYGENGKELSKEPHTYEIGSLTKTFTAALIQKAVNEGKLNMESTVDCYVPLPEGNEYPTVQEIVTHTAGYQSNYFERPMMGNFLKGRNDFYGITGNMIRDKAEGLNMHEESYPFAYSNYGYALLGVVLEEVEGKDYTTLVNDFCANELNLTDTKISDKSGDLDDYWDWGENDAYLPAGGLT